MLTDTGVRAAAAKDKPYKLADGGGLHVLVTPAGGKLWRLKYRFSGKEKLLAFGAYPTVSLRDARGRRDEAKRLLAAGLDPSAEKRKADLAAVVSSASTFDSVADEYIAKRRAEGLADATHKKLNWYRTVLNRAIGNLPVSTITPSDLLAALSKVQDSGKRATAHSLRGFAGSVFRYAIVTGRASRDPAADLKGALLAPRVQRRAALLEPKQIGALLRAIDGYEGQPETRHALQLLPHVFLRPTILLDSSQKHAGEDDDHCGGDDGGDQQLFGVACLLGDFEAHQSGGLHVGAVEIDVGHRNALHSLRSLCAEAARSARIGWICR